MRCDGSAIPCQTLSARLLSVQGPTSENASLAVANVTPQESSALAPAECGHFISSASANAVLLPTTIMIQLSSPWDNVFCLLHPRCTLQRLPGPCCVESSVSSTPSTSPTPALTP
jgi:hypothetical protein